MIIDGRTVEARNVLAAEVDAWRAAEPNFAADLCEPKDKLFPLRRMPEPTEDAEEAEREFEEAAPETRARARVPG